MPTHTLEKLIERYESSIDMEMDYIPKLKAEKSRKSDTIKYIGQIEGKITAERATLDLLQKIYNQHGNLSIEF